MRVIPQNIRLLLLITLIQCLLWAAYILLLMPVIHDSYTEEVIRSVVRISTLGIPALMYVKFYKHESIRIYFNNKRNTKHAVMLSLFVSLIILLLFVPKLHDFQFPLDLPAWLNWIIGSPLTEELYFRGIVLKEMSKVYSPIISVVGSSLLFLAFHLPQWIFTQRPADYIGNSIMIFIYGAVFAILWLKSKSITTALIPHSLNNFLYMATSVVR